MPRLPVLKSNSGAMVVKWFAPSDPEFLTSFYLLGTRKRGKTVLAENPDEQHVWPWNMSFIPCLSHDNKFLATDLFIIIFPSFA